MQNGESVWIGTDDVGNFQVGVGAAVSVQSFFSRTFSRCFIYSLRMLCAPGRVGLGGVRVLLRVVIVAGGRIVLYRHQHNHHDGSSSLSNQSQDLLGDGLLAFTSEPTQRYLGEDLLSDWALPVGQRDIDSTRMQLAQYDAFLWSLLPLLYVVSVAVLGKSMML